MNADIFNKNLLDAIKRNTPTNANMVTLLMDILSISKEAVYRRLRGDALFTLYETVLISKKLGIPLNSFISPSENLIYELKPQRHYNLREIDYKMLEEFLGVLKMAAQEANSEFVLSANRFPEFPSHKFYWLTKYSSFRWMYLNQDNSNSVKRFDEIFFPKRFFELAQEIVEGTMSVKNICYIWDDILFYGMVKEIKYFHGIHLINNEDLNFIKQDFHKLLDLLEQIAIKGQMPAGGKAQVYVSNVNFDATYCYLETDIFNISMIGAFSVNYLTATDRLAILKMKERIQSIKRVSTLISESGEIQRQNFFKQQREYVDSL